MDRFSGVSHAAPAAAAYVRADCCSENLNCGVTSWRIKSVFYVASIYCFLANPQFLFHFNIFRIVSKCVEKIGEWKVSNFLLSKQKQ